MPTKLHTELAFEEAIEDVLLQSGYVKGSAANYNKVFAVDESYFLTFYALASLKNGRNQKACTMQIRKPNFCNG